MIKNHILLINEIISAIKNKDSSHSSFDLSIVYKWELLFCITLEIISYELKCDGKISDDTAAAIEKPFVFQCFEYYKDDFPEIFDASGRLFDILSNYNTRLKTDSLEQHVQNTYEWKKYITRAINRIADDNYLN